MTCQHNVPILNVSHITQNLIWKNGAAPTLEPDYINLDTGGFKIQSMATTRRVFRDEYLRIYTTCVKRVNGILSGKKIRINYKMDTLNITQALLPNHLVEFDRTPVMFSIRYDQA